MDRPLFALCALLLNASLGGPWQWYRTVGLSHIFQIPAALLRKAERKLNREHRSVDERQWRGQMLTGLVLIGSLLAGWILGWISKHSFEFIEVLFLTALLPVRPTWDRVSQIRAGLYAGNTPLAHQALDGTPWRHHALLDTYGVARAGIEMLAVTFSDKIVAPLFWYLLLGLPGLFASKAIVLLQETLIQPGGKRFAPGFGQTAQIIHYWLHFIPARLAVIFWLIVAAVLRLRPWQEMTKEISKGIVSETPQIIALTSAACVLKLTLGGPLSLYSNEQWIGGGTVKPLPANIKQALHLFAFLHILLFILLGLFV